MAVSALVSLLNLAEFSGNPNPVRRLPCQAVSKPENARKTLLVKQGT